MTRIINPAGILDRLRHLQRTRFPDVPPNTMLLLYAQQGLLARLDASDFSDSFVLKGALSLFVRYGNAGRPTRDIDLAAHGLPNTPAAIRGMLEALCAAPFSDGLSFDPASVQVAPINETFDYPGVTARVRATLGPSQVMLQLDVSFGNVITPAPVALMFPPLLLDAGIRLLVYPLETVITEKFAALVELGNATTRMKDLYDLQVILEQERFDALKVGEALNRSFAARGTPVGTVPDVLSPAFAADAVMTTRWNQYLRRTGLQAPPYADVMALLQRFYGALLLAGRRDGTWEEGRWS